MYKFNVYVILMITLFADKILCNDFCDVKYCHNGDNIGCNNTAIYASTCGSTGALQKMSSELKEQLLFLHNDKRNNIAKGNLTGYSTAHRMTTMQWDSDLEYLAKLNCLRCTYGHDDCRDTKKYPHTGQNIALMASEAGYDNNTSVIPTLFNEWFIEYTLGSMNIIISFDDDGQCGHFTQVVSEKAAAIGCAFIRWFKNAKYYMYLVCNYSYTNVDGQPIYTPGSAASGCKTGVNQQYEALCSVNEVVQPIPYPESYINEITIQYNEGKSFEIPPTLDASQISIEAPVITDSGSSEEPMFHISEQISHTTQNALIPQPEITISIAPTQHYFTTTSSSESDEINISIKSS